MTKSGQNFTTEVTREPRTKERRKSRERSFAFGTAFPRGAFVHKFQVGIPNCKATRGPRHEVHARGSEGGQVGPSAVPSN